MINISKNNLCFWKCGVARTGQVLIGTLDGNKNKNMYLLDYPDFLQICKPYGCIIAIQVDQTLCWSEHVWPVPIWQHAQHVFTMRYHLHTRLVLGLCFQGEHQGIGHLKPGYPIRTSWKKVHQYVSRFSLQVNNPQFFGDTHTQIDDSWWFRFAFMNPFRTARNIVESCSLRVGIPMSQARHAPAIRSLFWILFCVLCYSCSVAHTTRSVAKKHVEICWTHVTIVIEYFILMFSWEISLAVSNLLSTFFNHGVLRFDSFLPNHKNTQKGLKHV